MIIIDILVAIILLILLIGYIVAGVFVAMFLFDDSGNRLLKKYSWIVLPLVTIFWLPGIIVLAVWCLFESYIDVVRRAFKIK
jgi:hypothetical protein